MDKIVKIILISLGILLLLFILGIIIFGIVLANVFSLAFGKAIGCALTFGASCKKKDDENNNK